MKILLIDGPAAGERHDIPGGQPFWETSADNGDGTFQYVVYTKAFGMAGVTFFSVERGAYDVQDRIIALIERGLQAEKEAKSG